MSEITSGAIVVHPEDEETYLAWEALEPLRWRGFEPGDHLVDIGHVVARVSLLAEDVAVLDRLDAFLEEIAERNGDALVDAARSSDVDDLRATCWFALAPVRMVGWGDGAYTVRFPGGVRIEYDVTMEDAALLRRAQALLHRVAWQNQASFDALLGKGSETLAAA